VNYDPNKLYHELIEAGNDWADKKAAYDLLEGNTKSVLANIKISYTGSEAHKTTMALGDTNYQVHLETVNEAKREFLFAQVKYDSMKALSDHRRTEQSTRRAEMKLT